MGQLEIILSVQATFTAHAFQQSRQVTGRSVQTFRLRRLSTTAACAAAGLTRGA